MTLLNERVLCVDDQQEIIDLLKRQLADTYDCVYATSGAEALTLIDAQGPFAAIVADYSMPNMDGITLLAEIHNRCPQTIPIMLTAFDDIDIAIAALHEGNIFRFLRKPWEADELKKAISNALDQHHLIANEKRLRDQLAEINAALDTKVKELDETNQLLEYWVEFSPAILYSVSVENGEVRPTYVSKNFSRLTGHERTAMIVDPGLWFDSVHPDDVGVMQSALETLVVGEAPEAVVEYRVRHQDGNYTRVLDAMRAIQSAEGEILEIVGAWVAVDQRTNPPG